MIEFAVETSAIDGLVIATMKQVADERGAVREFFRRSAFEAAGLTGLGELRQVNVTESRRGAVRGFHAEAMTKLVAVVHGRALGAYVDMRHDSPTFGAVLSVDLVAGTQVLVPSGVANAFQALDDGTQFAYCFDDEWHPGMPGNACTPLDPALGVAWPIPVDPDDRAQISVKDLSAPTFEEATRA